MPNVAELNVLEFTALVFCGGLAAGLLGSLTGLGGGVAIVPLLTLLFKVDIRYAIGASLVSVIATSSGAAAAYVKEGFTNLRVGMFLEVATTAGAMLGALAAAWIAPQWIAVIFGAVLIPSALSSSQPRSGGSGRAARPLGHLAPPGRPVPRRRHQTLLPRAPRPAGLLADAPGGRALRTAGHRLRRDEGLGPGPGHAHPLQGLHDHQQLHDRRDRGGQRRGLFEPRIH